MKRDRGTNTPLDRQLERLNARLREDGVAPERDLWPDIDRAIASVDRIGARPKRTPQVWRIAALAACLLLVVGIGLVQFGGLGAGGQPGAPVAGQDAPVGPVAMTGTDDGPSSMQLVDKALDELNTALAQDPNNKSLSRLILMLHRSRGDLVRNSARRLFNPGN